jgi:hypothetical protein
MSGLALELGNQDLQATGQVGEEARRCMSDPALITSIVTTLLASQSILSASPTTEASGELLLSDAHATSRL